MPKRLEELPDGISRAKFKSLRIGARVTVRWGGGPKACQVIRAKFDSDNYTTEVALRVGKAGELTVTQDNHLAIVELIENGPEVERKAPPPVDQMDLFEVSQC